VRCAVQAAAQLDGATEMSAGGGGEKSDESPRMGVRALLVRGTEMRARN
jgi:hypothetical protein